MKNYLLPILMILLVSVACKDNTSQAEIDAQIIDEYINLHNLTTNVTESGLHYIITDPVAEGSNPSASSTVTVDYVGFLTDSTIFDISVAPIELPLSQTIAGWREGIPYFKRGEKGMLIIPSKLGYGVYPQSGIPGNSVLIFEIELIDFYN